MSYACFFKPRIPSIFIGRQPLPTRTISQPLVEIIVNPAAGRKGAASRFAQVTAAFKRINVRRVVETRAAGDEDAIAQRALEAGVNTIVAVGGDGTCSGIARAIVAGGGDCSLAVVPFGTGNDFAKTLGVERCTPSEIAALVERDEPARMDVGRIEGRSFINSCGFGFDASVLEATKRVRLLKGDAVYVYSALRQLFTYRAMSVSVDANRETAGGELLMLTISNGQFLGGAFRIAPGASAVDGKLDIGLFSDAGLIGRVRIFAGAFRGTHVGLRSVETRRVAQMSLRFSAPPRVEIDGELVQALSSTVNVECLPRALSVIATPGYPR
ncbi:MAG TPA: diacylglycerol kinase family protein [Gemmatimonadaceae bacterium]|nr:diacylglycerol kinase family protein [Gemmatimonadaceae bacterium]